MGEGQWRQGKAEMCLHWRCLAAHEAARTQGGCCAMGWRPNPYWQDWHWYGSVSSGEQPWQAQGSGQNLQHLHSQERLYAFNQGALDAKWSRMQSGKSSAQDGLHSPITQGVLPQAGLYTPNGVTQPKRWMHLNATCPQRLPLMARDWEAVSASGMKVGAQAQPRRSCSERPGAT